MLLQMRTFLRQVSKCFPYPVNVTIFNYANRFGIRLVASCKGSTYNLERVLQDCELEMLRGQGTDMVFIKTLCTEFDNGYRAEIIKNSKKKKGD